MFEICGDDITLLGEEDLRTLIGRLCEADIRSQGLSSSAVTWGGHQKAADGGVDVRIALPAGSVIEGFVPRRLSCFQVKQEDMPRNRILEEMAPNGILRQAIRELATESGAYIIVSSKGATSDTALQDRRLAMTEAVAGIPQADCLVLDFYDRSRVATWVRTHPPLIPWVRERIGKPIQGWQSYGAWANAPEGVDEKYLLDEKVRIQTPDKRSNEGIHIADGLSEIRVQLMQPGGVVRLVGLSGVGKTRLAQALFDERIGENSLDESLAIYADLRDDLDPQPGGIVSDLLAGRTRAIVVVDNCRPDLHSRLSELCRRSDSSVSLLTIEYDIREDQPEGTQVFELQPASTELVAKLMEKRFPQISQIDAQTIANFSGGNARIAIALADTVGRGESLAGLKDEELFKRLFQQRHDPDNSLLTAAQACALLYSFNGEDVSNDAELCRLGSIVGLDSQQMFRHVAELRRRGLIQQRGVWRAVLPQAIADRLAALALQNIPRETVQEALVDQGSARMLQSFSRRLGYLHNSPEATSIVSGWLDSQGLLGEVSVLNEVGRAMFENIAPAAPEAALSALERAISSMKESGSSGPSRHVALIRSLAYQPELFDRSVRLLCIMAETEEPSDRLKGARESLASLFALYLSGTRAPVEQRLAMIRALLASNDKVQQDLGILALTAALEAWHFSSLHSFDFGAWSRDFGYWPKNAAQVKAWFRAVLELCETAGSPKSPGAPRVRQVLAEKFRGLWDKAGVYSELEQVCREFAKTRFWPDGWIAVRTTLHFDSSGFSSEVTARLRSLEADLRPVGLAQSVRSLVLPISARAYLDLDLDIEANSDPHSSFQRLELAAVNLGQSVATDESAFAELLPELLTRGGRLWSFGRGLMRGADKRREVWRRVVAQFAVTDAADRGVELLCGCLQELRVYDRDLTEALLDAAVADDHLGGIYPILESSFEIDLSSASRLKRSLSLGIAPTPSYRSLARSMNTTAGVELQQLLLAIAARHDGFDVALELVEMWLHFDKDRLKAPSVEAMDAGRALLGQLDFETTSNREDYRVGEIAKDCLSEGTDAAIAVQICLRLKKAIMTHATHSSRHDYLLRALASAQPAAVLNSFFSDCSLESVESHFLHDIRGFGGNPFNSVPMQDLLTWCRHEPQSRYPLAAAIITPFNAPDNAPRSWTETALQLLEQAPNPVEVLEQFTQQFRPMSWSGSRATAIELNASLLKELEANPNPTLAKSASQERIRLGQIVNDERRWETADDRAMNETFE